MDTYTCTEQQALFVDLYIKYDNRVKAYKEAYGKEGETKQTHRVRASYLLRTPRVRAYYEEKMAAIKKKSDKKESKIGKTRVDEQYLVDNLVKIIKANMGLPCAIKAIELLGRHIGLFWEAPAKCLPKRIATDSNATAVKELLELLQNGQVTESSASNIMSIIESKSKIEEREDTNTEILDKLDHLERIAKEKEGD